MGLLSRLFSSPDAINETIASARRGVDDLVFTDQEKSEFVERARDLFAELYKAALPSALSRRIIALALVGTYCFLAVYGVVVWWVNEGAAKFAFQVLNELFLAPVNVIVGFYFLTQLVGAARKPKV